jgi:hypothetical protein
VANGVGLPAGFRTLNRGGEPAIYKVKADHDDEYTVAGEVYAAIRQQANDVIQA